MTVSTSAAPTSLLVLTMQSHVWLCVRPVDKDYSAYVRLGLIMFIAVLQRNFEALCGITLAYWPFYLVKQSHKGRSKIAVRGDLGRGTEEPLHDVIFLGSGKKKSLREWQEGLIWCGMVARKRKRIQGARKTRCDIRTIQGEARTNPSWSCQLITKNKLSSSGNPLD